MEATKSEAAKLKAKPKAQTRRKRKLIIVPSLEPIEAKPEAGKSKTKTQTRRKRKLVIVPSHDEARLNEKFVDLLGELEQLMSAKGEPFRARAYQKAAESVMEMREEITSLDQLKGRPGIGKTILAKLQQFLEKGDIDLLVRERNNPLVVLTGVHGIGPKKAGELISKFGITDIAGLRAHAAHKVLSDGKTLADPATGSVPAGASSLFSGVQKTGIAYYAETSLKIPREEVTRFARKIVSVFEKLGTGAVQRAATVVGSYRRGKKESGDIDVIVTDTNGSPAIMTALASALEADGTIEVFLTRGKTKIMAIARLPGGTARRLDIMYAPPAEYPFAILYFTGSRSFNIGMRAHALSRGFSLSEHGLKDVKTGKLVDKGLKTERSIFEFLGLAFKEPHERLNTTSVVVLASTKPATATAAPVSTKPATAMAAPVSTKPVSTKRKTLKAPRTTAKRTTAMQRLLEFKRQGTGYIALLTEKEVATMVTKANELYRNAGAGEEGSPLSDAQYDLLQEALRERNPDNKALHCVGAGVERNKVKLPFTMYSMDKIKADTGALPRWLAKMVSVRRGIDAALSAGDFVVSAKLDGVSGLYTGDKLYTRGDGTLGQDVSNMIPFLRLPSLEPGIAVRGEFIFKKAVFDKHYKAKYANARNLVSGVVNAKKSADAQKYRHLDFVTYEVVSPAMLPSVQLEFLVARGFDVVKHRVVKTVNNDMLSALLQDWRETYGYETDGLVITDNAVHPRVDKNPEHAFAFKMVLGDQSAETVVKEVIWTPSKHGYLKPKLLVDPVVIGGSTIQYVTANNARYVADNKIGVGTVIELIRSGDVIPKVQRVIVPSDAPQMPSVPYTWNESGVDIMVDQPEESAAVRLRGITAFFAAVGVDGFGPGTAKRLFEAGFDTIAKVVKMSLGDMQAVIGKKNGEKVHANIKAALHSVPLAKLMGASGVLGRGMGAKRLQVALDQRPDLLSLSPPEAAKVLRGTEGFAAKTADQFAEKLPAFKAFLRETGITGYVAVPKKKNAAAAATGRYAGARIAFSGFRDAALTTQLEAEGATVVGDVSKNTTMLVVKVKGEGTGKEDKAAKLGIPVVSRSELEGELAK